MKPPQERKTPLVLGAPGGFRDATVTAFSAVDHDGVRVGRRGSLEPAYIHGRHNIETLRDYLDAWLEYDEDTAPDDAK